MDFDKSAKTRSGPHFPEKDGPGLHRFNKEKKTKTTKRNATEKRNKKKKRTRQETPVLFRPRRLVDDLVATAFQNQLASGSPLAVPSVCPNARLESEDQAWAAVHDEYTRWRREIDTVASRCREKLLKKESGVERLDAHALKK